MDSINTELVVVLAKSLRDLFVFLFIQFNLEGAKSKLEYFEVVTPCNPLILNSVTIQFSLNVPTMNDGEGYCLIFSVKPAEA